MTSEEQIKTTVEDQLIWDDRILSSDIDVDVSERKVILRGEVPSYYERLAAEDDAFMVPGVGIVQNELVVNYDGTSTIPSDLEIKSYLENALDFDNRIDTSDIDITVDNGVVSLEGSVGAYWKKHIVEDYASQITGVILVKNNLNVVRTRDYLDEDIAKDMKNAMERNALIDAEDVTVEVNNGVVTLRGLVDSYLQRTAAQEVAINTAGVVYVNNLLDFK